MMQYTVMANVDIIKEEKNTVIPYSIFQGTKGLAFNFKVLSNGAEITDFLPVRVNTYLVTYDRLDGFATSYSIGNASLSTVAGIDVIVNTDDMPELVAYPCKSSLIFELFNLAGNSIVTTPFVYNVIINHAYSLQQQQ